MASALSTIKKFMKVLDKTSKSGTSALNEAVKSVSNFSSWSELVSTMVKDCANFNGNGTAFLKNMCGINLSNSDTGAITGSDAGGGSTKTATSIVPESGSWKYPSKTSFKIQGLTVTVPKKSTLDSSEKYIVGGLYTWWINNSLSLIKNSFGLNFKTSGVTVKKIDVSFYNADNGKFASVNCGSGRKTESLQLKINMHYFEGIEKKNNPNGVGTSSTLTYLDRTIAHELTHAVMAANIDYFMNLPMSFREGSAELVHGIDDKRKDSIQTLAADSSKLRSALNGRSINSYAAGYIALRYLAKQAAANRSPSKNISANSSEQNIENYADENFSVVENNFSEKTAADELFQENNFVENNSALDEIISAKNFSVTDGNTNFMNNFSSLNKNFSVLAENAFSQKNEQI